MAESDEASPIKKGKTLNIYSDNIGDLINQSLDVNKTFDGAKSQKMISYPTA